MIRAKALERWALLAGALAGLVLAARSLIVSPPAELPNAAVAVVNGRPIPRAAYDRAVAALQVDRTDRVTEADGRFALERLIDEELLVQHGLELGLSERDPRVRAELVAAVLSAQVAQGAERAGAATEAELRALYDGDAEWFRNEPEMRVRGLRFGISGPDTGARERAEAARIHWLRGEVEAATELSDPLIVPIPDVPLTRAELADLIGPTPAVAAAELAVGEPSQATRGADGYWLLQVVERQPGRLRPFEEVRPLVEREYARRASEEALTDLLVSRRARSDVTLAGP